MKVSRRSLIAAGAGSLAVPARAAEATVRWRMVTSWPKNMQGPGQSARRLAERIEAMSNGRLSIAIFGAGEIVPAFSVFDAVAGGTVEMGHTASFFLAGKLPAASFFTTIPFGLGPVLHASWIEACGGQALWDELYAPFGVRAFLAGNTGPSLAGWFRRKISAVDDFKGLRIRVSGLGGELYRRLGATPQAIPPGDVYPSLERGVIDAVELLGPMNDIELGLQRIAPYCVLPGFNKPNGAAEALVNIKAYEALPADLRAIVAEACRAEHAYGLAEAQRGQGLALRTIAATPGVTLMTLPREVLLSAKKLAQEMIAEIAAGDAMSAKILASYRQAEQGLRTWDRLSLMRDEES